MICIKSKSESVKESADKLYEKLSAKGYEVLYDDRDDVTAGSKFKDADLIGVPIQLVISEKNMKNDEIELKIRRTGEKAQIKSADIINRLPNYIKNT